MYFSGWRAGLLVIVALVIVALLLTALFWLGVLLAALAAVAWLNIFLLPNVSRRTHIPELILGIALLPIGAAIGLGLAGTGGIIGGCCIWVLGVAGPRVAMWRMRRRLRDYSGKRDLRVIDARFETTRSD